MIITAWILFVALFVPTLGGFAAMFNPKVKMSDLGVLVWLLVAVVLALSAGVIWGGLFR